MTDPLLVRDGDPVTGEFVERVNRFVIRVDFGDGVGDVYLGDPGKLRNVLVPGYDVLCEPVDDPDRATDYDAIAIRVGDIWVSLRAALANDLFAAVLDRGILPEFEWAAAEAADEMGDPDYERVSSHDLRRAWANHLLVEENVSPRIVMALGGWSSYDAIEPYLAAPTEANVIESMSDVTL